MRKSWLVALLLTGCVVRAQPLGELSFAHEGRLQPRLCTERRILVVPFEDARGDVFAQASPDGYIPVVNWFHRGAELFYPENTGLIRYKDGRGKATAIGALGTAMPTLLTGAMRRMGLTSTAVAGGGNPNVLPADFDYVVTGRVVKTRFRTDDSTVLAMALGLVGVPYRFVRYELEYEIALYDNRDPTRPILQRAYTTTEHRAVGMYYNQNWSYSMLVGALEKTLPGVVADVATLIAARG